MAKPTEALNIRQSLLRILQESGGSAEEDDALARLQAEPRRGQAFYSTLLSLLTHLDFTETVARRHWQKVQDHRGEMKRLLKRDPGLRVALLDYFVNQTRVLRSPKVIELALYQRTEQTALTDALTGLFNRAYLTQFMRREMSRSQRHGRPMAVVLFDIDDFKRINDGHGHLEGDRVLARTAAVIGENLRDIDVAARYGGEEFAIVLPETTRAGAFVVAQRIRQGIENGLLIGRDPVTISGGVAAYPADGLTPQALLQKADQGLYRAKAEGKNRISPEGDERRQHGRVPWERVLALERPGGRIIDGRAHNLSEGGMLVSLPEAVPVGSTVMVMLHVADEGELALRGHVVRLASRAAGARYEAGLRLVTDAGGGNSLVLRRLLPTGTTA